MDRTSSRDSNSPTTNRVPEKPPFKLCFSKDQLPGKSSVRTSTINGDSVAPKFYSREYGDANDPNTCDVLEEITSRKRRSPKDAYHCRLLTSHAYGWWYEQGIQPNQSRFNFHKKTSDLVNFQMKVYAEDRRLGDPKH
ncbi:PREDICTED: uncharacterized protein LOC107186825 [Dufourea novaeangliae]|uniref:uncharacterized protein LOC107186825 n=1 Tax=Dufourea novaeangliae TaxID=178035 RepID=UPI00076748A7|nr:PREDICTED: uncharacterized protein LOC107186825 [Dufourea novaeangliae]